MKRFLPFFVIFFMTILSAGCDGGASSGSDDSSAGDTTDTGSEVPDDTTAQFELNESNIESVISRAIGVNFVSPLDGYMGNSSSQPASSFNSSSSGNPQFKLVQRMLNARGENRINAAMTPENYSSLSYFQGQEQSELSAEGKSTFIQRPNPDGPLGDWVVTTESQCLHSGTITTIFIDWDNSNRMDMKGEYGVEVYDNCNEGDLMIDGEFAMILGENLDVDNGKYNNLFANFEYTDLKMATLDSTMSYNGYFRGKMLNINNRNYIRYLGTQFDMSDNLGNFFELQGFDIEKIWYSEDYNDDNFAQDNGSLPLSAYEDIESIPNYVKLHEDQESAEELKSRFFVDQTYKYRSSDVESDGELIEVRTLETTEGILDENPVAGTFLIELPGYSSRVEMSETGIRLLWGEEFYGENEAEYDWERFQEISEAIRPE